jgi:ATP-dependent DNA ligase
MAIAGYRVQIHKVGSRVIVYSRNGHDFTECFPSIAQLLHELPAKAAIIERYLRMRDL